MTMAKFKKKNKKSNSEEKVHKKRPTILKRKLERKMKRETQKQGKKKFYEAKYNKTKQEAAPTQEELAEEKRRRKLKHQAEMEKRKQKKARKLEKEQEEQRKQRLLEANEEEDKNIRRLEKQLGLKRRKSKNLPKSFQDDGWDYLLGSTGTVTFDDTDEPDLAEMVEGSDDEDDAAFDNSDEEMDEGVNDDDEDEEAIEGEEKEFEDDGDEVEGQDFGSDDMEDGDDVGDEDDDNDEDEGDDDDDDGEDVVENNDDNDGTWEDIYGRMRSKDGSIIKSSKTEESEDTSTAGSAPQKYIPPALRKSAGSDDKKKVLERLAKQLKGSLNRLAEANMHSIAGQIENMYRQNSRNDMNQTLFDLIHQAVVTPVLTPERLVMEYAMLIAILHANIGSEVGAFFLEEFVKKFTLLYSETDLSGECGKEMDNIILIFCFIYNFRIVAAKFTFELLSKLVDSFETKDIELILLALRSSGFILRKDDPGAMKSLIIKIQSRASSSNSAGGDGSRVQFMLDVLLAVKNNNINKIPNYDPSHFDHLKKTIKSYIRDGNFITELKIGLKDLEEADTRGRWWIVGSFFAGNLAGEERQEMAENEPIKREEQFSEKLLMLARKMRMNTDSRREIFCLTMSSEDYVEGAERLIKLGTRNQTERDVMFVLLDCSMQEKEFNPFYSHVAIKLSSLDRKYKIANQFTVWDKIKLTQDLKESQVTNLGKYISHLIRERSQSISILKVVEFAEMTKVNVNLLRIVLCEVLLMESQNDVNSIFQAVSGRDNLKLFREGLRLFLRHFLLKQKKKLDPRIDFAQLEQRVRSAEFSLNTPGSSLKL